MTTVYATQVTQYYLNRDAAITASGSSSSPAAPFDFAAGTFAVGDGGGTVPSISTLIATGALVNQVWSGATISGVAQDATELNQIDITCVVPDTQGGVEVGGFTIREFAIYDELGNLCVVGVTNIEKTLSTEGQINTIMLIAAIATASTNNVTITPPTANFATLAQVETEINAHQPTAVAPLTQTDTTDSQGWLHRVFGVVSASEPSADPPTAPEDAAALGVGRPATASEIAAFAPTAGRFAFPWPTLQQLGAMKTSLVNLINAISIPGALAPLFLSGGDYGIAAATTTTVGAGRSATSAEAIAGATAALTPTPAWLTPEDLAAARLAPLPRIWTSSGTYTQTPGALRAVILLVAPGGGGAGNAGSGGGGGATVVHILALTGSTSFAFTLGAPGASVTGESNGNAGGNSSISSLGLLATGGQGGIRTPYGAGCLGGLASGGNFLNLPGGGGMMWGDIGSGPAGGGMGGTSFLAPGGQGNNANNAIAPQNGAYGSGGGAGYELADNSGVGGAPLLIVWEF